MTEGKFTWTQDMSVGVAILDEDHQILIQYLNDLIDACDDDNRGAVDSIFSGLVDYTEYHFKLEEQIMDVCGYRDLDAHKNRHVVLCDQLEKIRSQFLVNFDEETKMQVTEFLQLWLKEHILHSDMDYAPSCAGKENEIADIIDDLEKPASYVQNIKETGILV